MAYTPFVWKDDPTGGTPITATRLNAIEAGLSTAAATADSAAAAVGGKLNFADAPELIRDTIGAAVLPGNGVAITVSDVNDTISFATQDLWAPAPSGGDDTVALQSLVNQASNTGGTLYLRAGTYKANITINGGFIQPWIIGQGRGYTKISAFNSASPAVRVTGGSGSISGGGLRSLQVLGANQQGIGIQMSGCDGFQAEDVGVYGFSIGVNWNNEAGNWTEFCTFQGDINNCTLPFKYSRSSGATQISFHGSGIVGNTIVGSMANTSWPVIQVDDGCLPYNAPLNLSWFATADNQMLIRNSNAAGTFFPGYYGNVRMECQGMTNSTIGVGANPVYLQGTIQSLSGAKIALGNIYLARKLHYDGTLVVPVLDKCDVNIKCNNAPSQAGAPPFVGGENVLISVVLRNSGYQQAYILSVQTFYGGLDGVVQTIANNRRFFYNASFNYGDPTFSWGGGGLYISNSNFPVSTSADPVIAYVTYTPMGGAISNDTFPQYYA